MIQAHCWTGHIETSTVNQAIECISAVGTILSAGVVCMCVFPLSLWRKTPDFGKNGFRDYPGDKLILVPAASTYIRRQPESE